MGFDIELKVSAGTGFVFVMKDENGPGHPNFSFKLLKYFFRSVRLTLNFVSELSEQ